MIITVINVIRCANTASRTLSRYIDAAIMVEEAVHMLAFGNGFDQAQDEKIAYDLADMIKTSKIIETVLDIGEITWVGVHFENPEQITTEQFKSSGLMDQFNNHIRNYARRMLEEHPENFPEDYNPDDFGFRSTID